MNGRLKVVLDTNILVSALWSDNGNPAAIVKLIPKFITPCFSPLILSEYANVLSRPKFNFSSRNRELLLSKIKGYGELVTPPKSDIPMLDESDRVFYDTARTCGATLITGNIKHFPSEPFIVSPADFLKDRATWFRT